LSKTALIIGDGDGFGVSSSLIAGCDLQDSVCVYTGFN
jgi:hypothetical protein